MKIKLSVVMLVVNFGNFYGAEQPNYLQEKLKRMNALPPIYNALVQEGRDNRIMHHKILTSTGLCLVKSNDAITAVELPDGTIVQSCPALNITQTRLPDGTLVVDYDTIKHIKFCNGRAVTKADGRCVTVYPSGHTRLEDCQGKIVLQDPNRNIISKLPDSTILYPKK